ncbi:ABC transporter permease subunit [Actinomadura rayongensis]|uniref:ABC transporter permease subunit n=1 Tax=Actinomadura rayongensis TaxID=1429076 RepID=A0A6I4VZL8_9ACTN|nr:ABC transporter permease subunit [Actinomadura rayongensis]MXQ63789.1 ABC transporter permease subunit [Actinomadura rayongensis]
MRRAVHAEWTKLRTGGGILLAPLVLAVAIVGLGAVAAGTAKAGADPGRAALAGLDLGPAIVALLVALPVGAEYATGMIRTTLAATPRRSAVLAAKAVVLGGPVALAGAVAAAGALLAGRWLGLDLGPSGAVLRAAFGSTLFLVLVALLALGIAVAVRDAAAASGVVLGLFYLSPVLVPLVRDPAWRRHLEQITPMNAGLAVRSLHVDGLPIGPWKGLAVLAAWAAAALALGAFALLRRDA